MQQLSLEKISKRIDRFSKYNDSDLEMNKDILDEQKRFNFMRNRKNIESTSLSSQFM